MDEEVAELNTWHRTPDDVSKCEWVKFSTWKTDGGNFAYRMVPGYGFNDGGDGPASWSLPKPKYRDTQAKRDEKVKSLAQRYTALYDAV